MSKKRTAKKRYYRKAKPTGPRPEVGARVRAHFPASDTWYEGVVESLLSVQFTFRLDDGSFRFHFYEDAWETVSEAR